MSGWIKLHRKVLNHWIASDNEMLGAWIKILLEVNHEDTKVLIGNELIECKRGQSLKSIQSWAKTLGRPWNPSKIRRFFVLLKNDSMIETKSTNKTTILTVCNYDTYQNLCQTDDERMTNKRQTDDKRMTTNKKLKNEKKLKKEHNSLGESEKNIPQTELLPTWRDDFKVYREESKNAARNLCNDPTFISQLETAVPNLDGVGTIRKSWESFWGTENGWANKKKSSNKSINWRSTYLKTIGQSWNHVMKPGVAV